MVVAFKLDIFYILNFYAQFFNEFEQLFCDKTFVVYFCFFACRSRVQRLDDIVQGRITKVLILLFSQKEFFIV